jgi:hypothetical protein
MAQPAMGTAKRTIDAIIAFRAGENPTLRYATETKLILKGISVAAYTENTPDDPKVISRLYEIAGQMGLKKEQLT